MITEKFDICDEVLTQLRKIVRAMDMHSRQLQRNHTLTGAQLVLLRELVRHDGIAMGALARRVSLSHATVTGIVDRLERRGFVERLRNGKDRRQVLLSSTEAGRSMVEQAPALFQEQFITALRGLPQREQTQILTSLSHLATMMEGSPLPPANRPEDIVQSEPDGFLASCQMLLEGETAPERGKPASKPAATILVVRSEASLPEPVAMESLVQFLHKHLHPYEDTVEDIRQGLAYAFSPDAGRGGFVLLAFVGERLAGALVMLDTGMSGYVPEHLLLFVAVDEAMRGRGIGAQLIENARRHCRGDIKLHVEYHNPARRLYERMGFVSKYAEMRLANESRNL